MRVPARAGVVVAHAYVVAHLVSVTVPLNIRNEPEWLRTVLLPMLAVAALALTPRARLRAISIPYAVIAFAMWAAASLRWTSEFEVGSRLVVREIASLVALALVAGTIKPRHLALTTTGVFVGIGVMSVVRILFWAESRSRRFSTDDGFAEQAGWIGGFTHKNFLGVFAAFGLILVLAFAPRHWLRGFARGGLVAMFFVLVVGARSATAGAGVIAGAGAWFGVVWFRSVIVGLRARGRSATPAFLALGLASALGVVSAIAISLTRNSTVSGRTTIWRETLVTIGEHPLIGHGAGAVWYTENSVTLELEDRIGFVANHAHNMILDVWLSFGLVGVLLMIALLVRVGMLASRSLAGDSAFVFGRWAVATLAALVVMGVAEPLFRRGTAALVVLVWVVLANASRRQPEIET